jgi:hypothetical protein
VIKSKGFYNLGEQSPESFPPSNPYSSLTLDFQLDNDIRVREKRIEFGINGTFFNRDKGYKIPERIKEPIMPLYDPTIPS